MGGGGLGWSHKVLGQYTETSCCLSRTLTWLLYVSCTPVATLPSSCLNCDDISNFTVLSWNSDVARKVFFPEIAMSQNSDDLYKFRRWILMPPQKCLLLSLPPIDKLPVNSDILSSRRHRQILTISPNSDVASEFWHCLKIATLSTNFDVASESRYCPKIPIISPNANVFSYQFCEAHSFFFNQLIVTFFPKFRFSF